MEDLFKNVDVALPDSVSSKEAELEKILSIKVDHLKILLGKSIIGNKKLKLRVSRKLFIKSENSSFNCKSILKSPRIKILLDDSLGNKEEINSFVKTFIGSKGCLYMQPTITLVDFERRISTKVDLMFPSYRVFGTSLVDKEVFYLYKELGYVKSSSYLIEDYLDESLLIQVSVISRISKLIFNSLSSTLKS